MSPHQLNRAVAHATGESLSTIRSRGFSLLALELPDEDTGPQVLDWDAVQAQRHESCSAWPGSGLAA